MGLLLFAMYGCSQSGNGELIGVRSIPWSEPTPYGMVLVPQGSFEMGQAENDSIFGLNNPSKHVSVSSFWMDETEITNGQYKQFVQWVCDSIIREKLADPAFGGNSDYKITEDRYGEPVTPHLNWKIPLPDPRHATPDGLTALNYLKKNDEVNGKYRNNLHRI